MASLLFLIGVSLIYGVTGTLNMADSPRACPASRREDRALLEAGAAILGVAFLVKAAMWPLSFWLPPTYAAAGAPVAALFAVLTKVGVYAVLRLWLLLFGDARARRRFSRSVAAVRRAGDARLRRDRHARLPGLARLAGY